MEACSESPRVMDSDGSSMFLYGHEGTVCGEELSWDSGRSGLGLALLSVYGPFLLLFLEQDRNVFAFWGAHALQLSRKMLI